MGKPAESNDAKTDLEQFMEEAIAAGADIEDLQAILEDRALVVPDEDGSLVVQAVDDGEEAPAQRKRLTSIEERTGGDKQKARGLAEWLLSKRRSIAAALKEDEALAKWQKEEIDRWVAVRREKAGRKLQWYDHLLNAYMAWVAPDENKLQLLNGVLEQTKQRAKKVWDESKALAWVTKTFSGADLEELAPRAISKSTIGNALTKKGNRYYNSETGEEVDFVWEEAPVVERVFEVKQ